MSSELAYSLFESNIASKKTLLSPINLHFFYLNYESQNYDEIRKRFSISEERLDTLNDE